MKLITKDLPIRISGIAEDSRAMWIVASTEDIDRDGDRILSSGWRLENFMKNPVIPWAHQYGQPPVAKALSVKVEDRKLKLLIKFATAEEYRFADTIYRLYKGGYLNAFSVGFSPTGFEWVERTVNGRKTRGRDYHEVELWEVSAVSVPANPNALIVAREKGLISRCDYGRFLEMQAIREAAEEVIQRKVKEVVDKRIQYHLIDSELKQRGLF